ncbi:hypothetical protein [Candidatus Binatus sp.]|uniref:hypothetical protein n=1 Tax=Candidatus Binatus sp. TaxID=2811406 RepID=UPI003CB439F6
MKKEEAIAVLTKVKANWSKQTVDAIVAAEWAECLAKVKYRDAVEYVREYRDAGHEEPPTVGMIYRAARDMEDRREEEARRRRRLLDEPTRTPEQVAAARKLVRDFEEKLAERLGG